MAGNATRGQAQAEKQLTVATRADPQQRTHASQVLLSRLGVYARMNNPALLRYNIFYLSSLYIDFAADYDTAEVK